MGNNSRRGNDFTTFLFARPSALEGIARIADIFGTLNEYNRSSNPDAIAIRNDWRAVGQDIEIATATVMGDEIE